MLLQPDTENAHMSVQSESLPIKLPRNYRECVFVGTYYCFRKYSDNLTEKLPRKLICRNLFFVSEKIPTIFPRICRWSIFVRKFLQISDEFENSSLFSLLVVGDFPRTWVIGTFVGVGYVFL